ncbi:MAG: hypothetical protein JO057_30905 [Chloroflexi bacterium]|nr:hypothetical protein [Chloroflexota bacterium]
MQNKPTWTDEPAEHDYAAARTYLSLLMPPDTAQAVADRLRAAEAVTFQPKDLLRASRLPTLPASDGDVASDLKKIKHGEPLSPVLLVRGAWSAQGRPLEIADGYHRVSASLSVDENAEVPCRIADV